MRNLNTVKPGERLSVWGGGSFGPEWPSYFVTVKRIGGNWIETVSTSENGRIPEQVEKWRSSGGCRWGSAPYYGEHLRTVSPEEEQTWKVSMLRSKLLRSLKDSNWNYYDTDTLQTVVLVMEKAKKTDETK